jgi:hypothetical protein
MPNVMRDDGSSAGLTGKAACQRISDSNGFWLTRSIDRPLWTTGHPGLEKEFVGGLLPLSREGQTLPATWAFDETRQPRRLRAHHSPPQPTTTHRSQQDQQQQTGMYGAPENANSCPTQTGGKLLRVDASKLDMDWHGQVAASCLLATVRPWFHGVRAPSFGS